ncbi:MAG: flagellar filament capping protein FliD [Butyribacter sp.]|nr:flagellar filament capping protein FliD [bacterium]MDY3853711.1 flagellar filament capping protein FliD [Butyribacter sp.]
MAIRMTGLNSGLDTDTIVQALMSAQRMKKTKVESKKTKLEWKKEIWSGLNTKLYSFYTDSLSKIKTQGVYKTKAATSSDNSKVTATATSTAAEGTYKVKVNSLASAQYVTSGKLNKTVDENGKEQAVTSKTKLVNLKDASGNATFTSGTQITVNSASGTKILTVDENTSVNDFVSLCNDAGLNASFDEKQQRFFISSGSSGSEQAFTITAGSLSQDQIDTMAAWKEAVGYDSLSTADKTSVTTIFNKLQTGDMTAEKAMESLEKYVDKSRKSEATSYYKQQLTDDYNTKYFADEEQTQLTDEGMTALLVSKTGKTEEEINNMSEEERNQAIEDLKLSDEAKAKAVKKLVTSKVSADIKTDEYKDKIADAVENGIADDTASEFLQATRAENVSALQTTTAGYNATMSTVTDANSQLQGLGLSAITGSKVDEGSDASGMVVIEASDAEIEFNGATLTSDTASLTVNGLTLNILDVTAGDTISISVTKDTSAVYDSIKDFISEYNALLKEMNTYYSAESARDYDVLTDEQKEAMSDDEVEKWETKIKDSLLRRDDTLSALVSSFRNNMSAVYTASNGKKYSLSSLGICTSTDYAEGGLLHIKGDEDDSVYADSKNTLESLLNSDPDLVMEVFTGLTSKLYSDLQKKMGTSTLSSALTFYNDKEMTSQISDYKEEITKWESKLNTMEDNYYSQFTAMEKAMASLNSQQSLFGYYS